MLCRYKDILGSPGNGVHSYRFLGIAIVDVILTILLAYTIRYFTQMHILLVLLVLSATGIALHWLFCVETVVNIYLFAD